MTQKYIAFEWPVEGDDLDAVRVLLASGEPVMLFQLPENLNIITVERALEAKVRITSARQRIFLSLRFDGRGQRDIAGRPMCFSVGPELWSACWYIEVSDDMIESEPVREAPIRLGECLVCDVMRDGRRCTLHGGSMTATEVNLRDLFEVVDGRWVHRPSTDIASPHDPVALDWMVDWCKRITGDTERLLASEEEKLTAADAIDRMTRNTRK